MILWTFLRPIFWCTRVGIPGAPLWHGGLKIWCHCSGSGRCCSLGSIPGPGISTCCGRCPPPRQRAGIPVGWISRLGFVGLRVCLSSALKDTSSFAKWLYYLPLCQRCVNLPAVFQYHYFHFNCLGGGHPIVAIVCFPLFQLQTFSSIHFYFFLILLKNGNSFKNSISWVQTLRQTLT